MSIEVRAIHISKTLNTTAALTDVSSIFDAGIVHGIVGPNGAGKTTFLRLIKGLLHPTQGKFEFAYQGKVCSPQEAISRMGYFPQELLAATGMTPFKDRPAGKLSGGMYKKLGLMSVLLNRPALLLLDEPTIGVDPVSRQELWDIVYNVAGPEMTVILSTSYMDEAERCAKVHVLQNGHLLADGQPHTVMQNLHVTNFAELFLKHE